MSDDIIMTDVSASGKKEKKEKSLFVVKKWNAVALWSYNLKQENCTICHSNIMEPCIECLSKANNDENNECKIAWGPCGVCFSYLMFYFAFFILFYLILFYTNDCSMPFYYLFIYLFIIF